jgi:Spy/CpxP family protein refolding chaperone
MRVMLHERMQYSNSIWKHDSLLSYEKLSTELNLTADQRRALKTILDDYARYHQDLQAQLDDWRATGKSQIMRILAPEQRARFEQLTKQAESAN